MTLQSTLRAFARTFVGLALVAGSLPLMANDAEAGRRVSAASAAPVVRTINRDKEEKTTEEPAAQAEDVTASSDNEAAPPVARAQAVVKSKAAKVTRAKDIEVPGCSPGMICTVCLAGCNGAVNVIVHAVPKQK
jgi:hypothetical protein